MFTSQTIAIDTDPGVDDAVAIALATRSRELTPALVTTTTGNVALETATANALALLELLGRGEVPVAVGAARGLVALKGTHPALHGDNGLGGVRLPDPQHGTIELPAVRALGELLGAEPEGSVTIVAIAPLTNVALLLGAEPELAARARRVVIMGGAGGAGNVTPAAEYNVWADPEAAARVLCGGELEVWLVPLEVTCRATLGQAGAGRLRAGSPLGAELHAMVGGYGDGPIGDRALHDAVAVAAVLDPSLIETAEATVAVDTGHGPQRGRTRLTFGGPDRDGSPVRVATDLDVERWRALIVDRLCATRHR